MLHRCDRCSRVVGESDQVVFKGRVYHPQCAHKTKAETVYAEGFRLMVMLTKQVRYLRECDPAVILKGAEAENSKIRQAVAILGFDPDTGKEFEDDA